VLLVMTKKEMFYIVNEIKNLQQWLFVLLLLLLLLPVALCTDQPKFNFWVTLQKIATYSGTKYSRTLDCEHNPF